MPYFDEATETLPREQLAELQSQKLSAMLNELWDKNQFYTNIYHNVHIPIILNYTNLTIQQLSSLNLSKLVHMRTTSKLTKLVIYLLNTHYLFSYQIIPQ